MQRYSTVFNDAYKSYVYGYDESESRPFVNYILVTRHH